MAKQTKNPVAVEAAATEAPAAKPAPKTGKGKTVWQVTDGAKQALLDAQNKFGGTQEQVMAEILEVYSKVSSGAYHNEQDKQQLAELTEEVNRLGNLVGNPEETQKLTEETARLTKETEELTARNQELTERLTALQLEVNSAGETLTAKQLELETAGKKVNRLRETFGVRNWDLLYRCISVFNREHKVSATPEQYLMALFEHYQVLQNNYTLHDPLSRSTIRETIKKYADGNRE
ncbi:MAG: hypothetical protein NC324_02260 [Bacteroides sp.]|nr:hypothetical protein [Bacteroides sp.]